MGGIILTKHLPTYSEYIVRVGRKLIARHGESALVQAEKQISICESEGFNSAADDWKLIREAIRLIQQRNSTIEGYKKTLNGGIFLSE